MTFHRTIVPTVAFIAVISWISSDGACAQSNVQQRTAPGSSKSNQFARFSLGIGPAEPNEPRVPGPNELRIAGRSTYHRGYFVQAQRLLERAMALAVERGDTYILALLHDDVGCIYH